MRFIDEKIHGIIDYAAALALIIAPFLVLPSTDGLAVWLSVVAGAGLIVYSLFTSYSLGLRGLVPFRVHLAIDLVAGAAFVAAPFVLGFTGVARIYYPVMGVAVILVVLATNPRLQPVPAPVNQTFARAAA